MRARTMILFAITLVAARSGVARADDGVSDAQLLFDEGRELVVAKRYADACPKLAESLRREPGIGTMLWLADCYEKNGQTASGQATFRAAATLAAQRGDLREQIAERRAAELEPRLTRVVVAVPEDSGIEDLETRRDGVALTKAEL